MLHTNLSINEKGNLNFAGVDTIELAKEFGTPLMVMDEARIRNNFSVYKTAMAKYFGNDSHPLFASKAFSAKYIYRIAKEEGFDQIAYLFEQVAEIEKEHENRYRKLISNIEGGLVFSRDNDMIWQCRNCGHIVIGKGAPNMCPVCKHEQSYFQIKAQNY